MRKKLLTALLVVGVLAGAAFAYLIYNVNPILEKFRPQITQIISDSIKQPVQLGSIEASFFPSVAINIQDVGLKEASEAASVESLRLATGLAALLSGSVSVSELSIEGASLTLTREADGSLNVGGIPLGAAPQEGTDSKAGPSGEQETGTETKTTAETSKPKASSARGGISFKVVEAAAENLNLVFVDKSVTPTQTISVKDIALGLSDIDLSGKGDFSLAAAVLDSPSQNLSLKGTLMGLNQETGLPALDSQFALTDLNLGNVLQLAKAYGVEVEGLSASDLLSLSLNLKSDGRTFDIETETDASQANIRFKNQFTKEKGKTLSLSVTGEASPAPTFNSESMVLKLGGITINTPLSYAKTSPIKAGFLTDGLRLGELAEFVPMLKPFNLTGTLNSNASVVLPQGATLPSDSDGTIELRNVGARVALTPSSSPLTVTDVNAKVELNKNEVVIKGAEASVAGQALTLGAKVQSLAKPKLSFALDSPRLAFAPLMAPLGPVNPALENAFVEQLKVTGTYNTASKNGNVSLTTSAGSIADVPLGALAVDAKVTEKVMTLEPSTLSLLGGTLNVEGQLQQNKQQSLTASLSGAGVALGKLFSVAMPGASISLTGTVEKLATTIKADLKDPLPTANGNFQLDVGKGAIEGINIFGTTLAGIGVIPGLGSAIIDFIPEEHRGLLSGESTGFESLTARATIGGGNINLQSARINHPVYVVESDGTIALAGDMNLSAELRLTPLIANQMVLKEPKIKLLQDRAGNIVIPIKIMKKGTKTRVLPDTSKLVKQAARATATEAASKALDRVAPGLGGATKALDGLFGR